MIDEFYTVRRKVIKLITLMNKFYMNNPGPVARLVLIIVIYIYTLYSPGPVVRQAKSWPWVMLK